ncbi:MAG: DNA repair protein RecO [Patescibacteria group bacterium]
MALQYRSQGFVFQKEDKLEADRVFSVFTQDFGRLEIYGKAIRKIDAKLRSGIEIFSFSDIEFVQGKHRKTLTDAVRRVNFANIQKVPEKMMVALEISELMSSLIKGSEPDVNIFQLVKEVFYKLDSYAPKDPNYKRIYYYFFWNFIGLLGYHPEILRCALCRGSLSGEIYFSCHDGGTVCYQCANNNVYCKKTHKDAIKILRIISAGNWDIFSKLKADRDCIKSLSDISNEYRDYIKG